jgi:lysophospholipase
MARPGFIEAIATPVLVLAASQDKLVSASSTRRLAGRLTNGSLHVYGADAAHELLREADPVRNDVLARITAFLDRVAPAR